MRKCFASFIRPGFIRPGIIQAGISRLWAARRGNVAVLYAVGLVPVMIAVGGGLDYARAVMVHTEMSNALDAAALALGASGSMSDAQAQNLAQQYFNANYHVGADYGTPGQVTLVRSGQQAALSATTAMPTAIVKVVGINTWQVSASTTVVWGQNKLWVSLVLDNTGSMSQTDSTGLSKISALKTASKQLLTMLQGAAQNPGDVQVSIVPFARDVKIGTSYSTANWLSFSDFTAAPPAPASSVGPGSTCPWSDGNQGYHCTSGSANGAADASNSKVPTSGLICPSVTKTGHYWNGCYTSVNVGTSKNPSYNHVWTANAVSSWGGCVTDRGPASGPLAPQNYDTTNTTPAPSDPNSLMVAENSPSCPVASILPLGYDWTALANRIDAMSPNGSTNQTIGLAWGWQTLSQGAPYLPPPLPDQAQRIIILLSDGLNTQNRWYGDGSNQSTAVDARMAMACTNAKADGVVIYAVFVDLNGTSGNSAVLQKCASDSSKYFDLTTSGQIVTAFAAIGRQITNLHVAQ